MNTFALRHKTLLFYVFAFVIAWSSWLVMSRIHTGGPPGALVYAFSTLGGLGPLLSLALLDRVSHGAISVRQVLAQIRIRRPWSPWFVPAALVMPLVVVLGNAAAAGLGWDSSMRLLLPGPDVLGVAVVPVMIIHFAASLATSPLFEEPGWRGFALGPLQARFGRTVGSLIVGLLWWLWHQPMNLTFGLQPTLYAAASMLALSFMIDSLFNLSGRNVFTAMLAHQSSGTVIAFVDQGDGNPVQLGLLIAVVLVLRWREHRGATGGQPQAPPA